MRITSKKVVDNSGRTAPVSVDKEITVKAGWKDGTKITFENEGDEGPGVTPADIVFTLHTKPHERFVREGDNLVYTVSDLVMKCFICYLFFRLVVSRQPTRRSLWFALHCGDSGRPPVAGGDAQRDARDGEADPRRGHAQHQGKQSVMMSSPRLFNV